MEIRKAAAEDFDIVFDFIEKLWTYNTYDREEIRKVYMDVINDERSFAFLLWDEGICRGMCHGDYFNTFWMSGPWQGIWRGTSGSCKGACKAEGMQGHHP